MHFSITVDYTPAAINAMRENPTTNRREAVEQLITAAGGKLVAWFGRVANGPGGLAIFDVPDPAMAAPICSIVASSDMVRNVKMERLLTQEEIVALRQNAARIRGSYKAPGQ
jgi:uncharacterized protein with GYD domain